MTGIERLRVKVFADGADTSQMRELHAQPYIKGFTTNPTLMSRAGVCDYRAFAREVLTHIKDKPVCFEVISDEFAEMERQAVEISGWGHNVYVKIPVTNTRGEGSYSLVRRLASRGVKVNVTAVMTLRQVRDAVAALNPEVPSYVSVFAGRIADTGLDPVPLILAAVHMLEVNPNAELVWASPRELLNILQADRAGCHVITATHEMLRRLPLIGRDLDDYSRETVQMFYDDARSAGLSLCK